MTIRRPELFGDLAAIRQTHASEFALQTRIQYRRLAFVAASLLALLAGYAFLGFTPQRLLVGLSRFGQIFARMMPPTPETWERFWFYMQALGQTLGLAFLGVLGAALIAFPLALLAARNVTGSALLHHALRRAFDILRTIDRFIWALIFVRVVGLGPFAGVLAMCVGNIGLLGKLFCETLESTQSRPAEGVLSTGGSKAAAVRFGLIPQAMPVLIGQMLYYFESDTRSATIIGIVGAGGIGLILYEEIRTLEWNHVAFLMLMIVVAVAIIDFLSQALRRALIGQSR